jgi:8-oxo-dGTP pyrophosphatase MutT (NUDIX family)
LSFLGRASSLDDVACDDDPMMPGGASKLSSGELEEHARRWPESGPVVARMLALARQAGDPFSRGQLEPGHFTASAFVLDPDRRRVLLVHHRKLGRWLQPGGHVEASDTDLVAAARREVQEETGIAVEAPLGRGIFDVDIHAIPANSKDEAHLHFDVRYAFVGVGDRIDISPELLAVRWVELDAVSELTDEDSVLRCVERLRSAAP